MESILWQFRAGPRGSTVLSSPPSLYFSYGRNFCKTEGCFGDCFDPEKTTSPECVSNEKHNVAMDYNRFGNMDNVHGLIITSSPLSRSVQGEDVELDEEEEQKDEAERLAREGSRWRLLPRNTLLLCRTDPKQPSRIVDIRLKPLVMLEKGAGGAGMEDGALHITPRKIYTVKSVELKKSDSPRDVCMRSSQNQSVPSMDSWSTLVVQPDDKASVPRDRKEWLDLPRFATTRSVTARRRRSRRSNSLSAIGVSVSHRDSDSSLENSDKEINTTPSAMTSPTMFKALNSKRDTNGNNNRNTTDELKPLFYTCLGALALTASLQMILLFRVK
jgi:hypothetical protein